jgi:hypothetical protein
MFFFLTVIYNAPIWIIEWELERKKKPLLCFLINALYSLVLVLHLKKWRKKFFFDNVIAGGFCTYVMLLDR